MKIRQVQLVRYIYCPLWKYRLTLKRCEKCSNHAGKVDDDDMELIKCSLDDEMKT